MNFEVNLWHQIYINLLESRNKQIKLWLTRSIQLSEKLLIDIIRAFAFFENSVAESGDASCAKYKKKKSRKIYNIETL